MREFSSLVESEDNLYEYRLQEGECVIFNNRRVLHGRRQFDTATGMRWLKGAYIDTDVFMSKWRVLSEKFGPEGKEAVGLGQRRLVNSDAGDSPVE
jgi:gamma-butyrobetaine dioxygenase